MNYRLIVTGVDGFVGRHIAHIAAEQGIEVYGISRAYEPDVELARDLAGYAGTDLRREWPSSVPQGVPVVHLAALSAVGPSFSSRGCQPNSVRMRSESPTTTSVSVARNRDRSTHSPHIAGYDLPFAEVGSPILFEAAFRALQGSAPHVVFICLAFPKGEILALELKQNFPDHVFIGAGAGAQFNSGALRRAPKVMQVLGLEWIWRMFQDPRRMVARYLKRDLPWLASMMCVAVWERVARYRP